MPTSWDIDQNHSRRTSWTSYKKISQQSMYLFTVLLIFVHWCCCHALLLQIHLGNQFPMKTEDTVKQHHVTIQISDIYITCRTDGTVIQNWIFIMSCRISVREQRCIKTVLYYHSCLWCFIIISWRTRIEREKERQRERLIDCFIKRMTVLGRGLVFQPVLVTQTCTYNSNNIAYQNIGIIDFPSKNKNQNKKTKIFFKRTYQPPPPPPTRPKKKKKKKKNQQKKPWY